MTENETLIAEANVGRDGVVGGKWFQGVPVKVSFLFKF